MLARSSWSGDAGSALPDPVGELHPATREAKRSELRSEEFIAIRGGGERDVAPPPKATRAPKPTIP
jgi:hypothetical protein